MVQKFTNKTIKRTDLLVRYPDAKNMVRGIPKESSNFPFIMLYKTSKGRVFGSFS
jgi:hypothetical protein